MADVHAAMTTSASGLGYSFLSYKECVRAVRPAMITHGVVMQPVSTDILDNYEYTTDKGRRMTGLRVAVTYEFIDTEDGDRVSLQTIGEAVDSSDKCAAKAQTMAAKEAIRRFFLLEHTDDDPDFEKNERQASATLTIQRAITAMNGASSAADVHKIWNKCHDLEFVTITPDLEKQLKKAMNQALDKLGDDDATDAGPEERDEPPVEAEQTD